MGINGVKTRKLRYLGAGPKIRNSVNRTRYGREGHPPTHDANFDTITGRERCLLQCKCSNQNTRSTANKHHAAGW